MVVIHKKVGRSKCTQSACLPAGRHRAEGIAQSVNPSISDCGIRNPELKNWNELVFCLVFLSIVPLPFPLPKVF